MFCNVALQNFDDIRRPEFHQNPALVATALIYPISADGRVGLEVATVSLYGTASVEVMK